MKETILVGVGITARLHKTDDVWFMYVTVDGTKIVDEQLTFKLKREATAMFNKLNKRIQGVTN